MKEKKEKKEISPFRTQFSLKETDQTLEAQFSEVRRATRDDKRAHEHGTTNGEGCMNFNPETVVADFPATLHELIDAPCMSQALGPTLRVFNTMACRNGLAGSSRTLASTKFN